MKILSSIILNLMFLGLWGCSDYGEPLIKGCIDPIACNTNLDATHNDDSCIYPNDNYDCDNNCITELDVCGMCDGVVINVADCCEEGSIPDCEGLCGGSAVEDCNGECGGPAIEDTCGVCDGLDSICNISYSEIVEPLLSSCIGCHGNNGGLNLSSYTSLMLGGNSGSVVTLGDGAGSLLIKKLRGTASGDQMPINGTFWDDANINLIETWINEGALDN